MKDEKLQFNTYHSCLMLSLTEFGSRRGDFKKNRRQLLQLGRQESCARSNRQRWMLGGGFYTFFPAEECRCILLVVQVTLANSYWLKAKFDRHELYRKSCSESTPSYCASITVGRINETVGTFLATLFLVFCLFYYFGCFVQHPLQLFFQLLLLFSVYNNQNMLFLFKQFKTPKFRSRLYIEHRINQQ